MLAQYDTADSKLTTRRIWLHGTERTATALLLSYGAAGRAPGLALPAGLVLDAELTAYPGAGQLRADLGEQFARAGTGPRGRPPGIRTDAGGQPLRRGAARRPLAGVLAGDARPKSYRSRDDGAAGNWPTRTVTRHCRSTPYAASSAGPVAAGGPVRRRPVTVFGECGHQGFTPLAAWSSGAGEPVTLC